jgi:hypothetical protein
MNKLYVAAITALLFSVPLLVQADSHEAGESQEKWEHYIEQWQGRMNTMHEQMDRIHQTQDPQERQRLLEEHWVTMDQQMRDMRMMEGMTGGMMGGMHGRQGNQGRGHMHMMDPEQQGRYMQDRMDMMQMMMEQMMQHNHMMMREGMR